MTDQEFEEHVGQLERIARDDPRRYRARVTGLALLGYAYLLAVLGAVFALTTGAWWAAWNGTGGAFQLVLVSGALAVDIVRALWVRLPAPAGIALTRARDATLLQRVEEICRAVGAPRPHVVLATCDLNASVQQIPRLGVLGWQKNYLLIGLPLMRALSPAEFDSLLAHEFGHLAGSHGQFNAWIYRLRVSWRRLLESLERKKSVGTLLFQLFARWYVPRFNATSLVQARAQEYEADQASARLCSPRTAADTLLRVAIASARMQEDFWEGLWRRARVSGEPPATVFELLGAGLESGELSAELRGAQPRSDGEIIAAELRLDTTVGDTHPCLRERLTALGVGLDLPPLARIETSAASRYLSGRAPELEAAFSREWREAIREAWSAQFAQAEANRARLVALEALARARALEVEELWEQVGCLWSDERRREALAVLRALAEQQPDFALAQRSWGVHLLESGDEAGLAHVERALALSRDGGIGACAAAHAFLEARGRGEEARSYAARARLIGMWLEGARAERVSVDRTSALKPPAVTPAALESLREQLRADPRIARAYLVEKVLTVAPEHPVYLVAFRLRREWLRRKRTLARVQQETAGRLVLDGDCFYLALGLAQRSLRRHVLAAAGEPFYRAR